MGMVKSNFRIKLESGIKASAPEICLALKKDGVINDNIQGLVCAHLLIAGEEVGLPAMAYYEYKFANKMFEVLYDETYEESGYERCVRKYKELKDSIYKAKQIKKPADWPDEQSWLEIKNAVDDALEQVEEYIKENPGPAMAY